MFLCCHYPDEEEMEAQRMDDPKHEAVTVHVCDSCCYAQGVRPKVPADSREASWLCKVCGHFGIGSSMTCTVGDWNRLEIQPLNQ